MIASMHFRKYLILAFGFVALVAIFTARPAQAMDLNDMLRLGLEVESDIRYIVEDYRGLTDGDGYKFGWNRNEIELSMEIFPGDTTRGVFTGRYVFYGFSEVDPLTDVAHREYLDPYYFQLDEAFLDVRGFIFDSLDLRIGRQIVTWGTADLFNPTDVINSRDLSDYLNYSGKVSNNMINLTWYPHDIVQFSLIWVPVFKPARLPDQSIRQFLRLDQPLPLHDTTVIPKLMKLVPPGLDWRSIPLYSRVEMPEFNMQNSQVGVKARFHLGDVDTSVSYYYGRFGFPMPLAVSVEPDLSEAEIVLYYPRFQMIGLDAVTSLSWFFDIGVFAEAAVYFPERVEFAMSLPLPKADLERVGLTTPLLSENLNDPFVKATVGVDYTWGSHVYTNLQYVYGFFDEFGDLAGLRHYLAPVVDIKFFDDTMLLRLAASLSLSDWSAALTPMLQYTAADGVDLSVGALVFTGETEAQSDHYMDYQKFGMKAAGRSFVYVKARVSL